MSGALARRLVERLGGRFSTALGLDVDAGDDDIEGWALAATLLGARIQAGVAERTYRTLARAGVRRPLDAAGRSWDELVALLDEGGYVRYDFRTATLLQALAAAVRDRHGGRIASLGRALQDPAALEAALDALPGWGPVTVRLFLRELRGVWPGADPPLDPRARRAAEHLGLEPWEDGRAWLAWLAGEAGVDRRDLEAALIRAHLGHGRRFSRCPGGRACPLLADRPAATG